MGHHLICIEKHLESICWVTSMFAGHLSIEPTRCLSPPIWALCSHHLGGEPNWEHKKNLGKPCGREHLTPIAIQHNYTYYTHMYIYIDTGIYLCNDILIYKTTTSTYNASLTTVCKAIIKANINSSICFHVFPCFSLHHSKPQNVDLGMTVAGETSRGWYLPNLSFIRLHSINAWGLCRSWKPSVSYEQGVGLNPTD